MSVRFIGSGDMFADPGIRRYDHIPVVAVNTVGVMGAGQALAYRRWDEAGYHWYRRLCEQGSLRLGEVYLAAAPGGLSMALLFPTMHIPGDRSRLGDIERAAENWATTLTGVVGRTGTTWHVPKLGCGIGGLAWPDVAAVLVDQLNGIEGHTFLLYGPEEVWV